VHNHVATGLNSKPILRFNTSQSIKIILIFSTPYLVYTAKQTGPSRGRVLNGSNNNWFVGGMEVKSSLF
jgi:hypothetical protein